MKMKNIDNNWKFSNSVMGIFGTSQCAKVYFEEDGEHGLGYVTTMRVMNNFLNGKTSSLKIAKYVLGENKGQYEVSGIALVNKEVYKGGSGRFVFKCA